MKSQGTNRKPGPIRVLFIVPSLVRAGAETQVVDLANGLDPSLFEKHLFTFSENLDQAEQLKRDEVVHYNFPRRYRLDVGLAQKIANVIDSKQIDLVHATLQISLFMGWFGRLISHRCPTMVNALHRTLGRNRREELLEHIAYQWPMRRCKSVICVCKNQESYWRKRFAFLAGRTRVIYNGVDTERFDPEKFQEAGAEYRQGLGIPDSAGVAACVAGFRVEKNHVGLLEAFRYLNVEGPDPYLLLAGDGQERPAIEKLVAENGLQHRVRFLGNVKDIRPVLAASDLTVLASTAIETFSIAMLESMAMATPVITTDIGGQKEAVLDGDTGRVVPAGNPAALGAAMKWCLSESGRLRAMGKKSRERVLKEFSLQRMVSETERELIQAVNT